MPHSPEDKKRILTRVRRIRGQTEAMSAPWKMAIRASPSCNKSQRFAERRTA